MVAVEPLTIGELAARLGVPVRTVRFWSDEGLVAPPARSGGGYRLYDAPSVARLDLVRTLRELGLGLPAIRELLAQRRSVREVAAEHVRALDGEIRLLRLRRTLLQHVATVGSTTEEMRIVHDLATLSARERQQMIDDFVARVFGDVPDDAPGAGIAQGMRTSAGRAARRADPGTGLRLAGAGRPGGRRVVRGAGAGDGRDGRRRDAGGPGRHGRRHGPDADARAAGARRTAWYRAAPDAERLVAELLDDGRATDADRRTALADRLAVFTDARVERYWQLLGVLNGWPPFEPAVPAVEWWIGALRARPE